MLHSLFTARQAESSEKPLLLHSTFHNSPASAVYLLRRGINSQSADNEGRTLFHVCAYTGHMEVLKAVRNELKLTRIQQLNNQYVSLLNNSNYKRTDAKGGKLKMSVSAPRQRAFELMQGAVSDAYEKYVMDLVKDTFEVFATALKSTNRNCFHLASLNRFQGCYNTLEVMFEELADINLHLDATALQLYHQVNACFPENSRIDPRLF
jgi:ankyrin repeat protein